MRWFHERSFALLPLFAALLACDPLEPSDEGQYELAVGLVDQIGSDARRVLVGSEFELGISSLLVEGEIDPDGGGLQCATSTATGVLTETSEGIFRVTDAGPGAVEFAAPIESCPANDDVLVELSPDSWTMTGVEAEAATARWVAAGDNAALSWNMSPGPAAGWPTDFGEPLVDARVAADGHFQLAVGLFELAVGPRAEVRWTDVNAFVTVPAHYEELATYIDSYGERHRQAHVDGRLRAGVSVPASVTIVEHEFELPTIRSVAIEQITDLELVPVYVPSDEQEREWGPPAGIVAITRDAQGRRVVGAPVEWEVTRGRVYAQSESFADDVIELGDCRDEPRKPQWRSATVEATLDDLDAIVELQWIALPSDDIDPTSPQCSASACECSTGQGPAESALASLGLLLLGASLRRHSKRRSAASTDPTYPPPNNATCTSKG